MTAAAILDRARSIVTGDRRTTHGAPERCFGTIAAFWRIYLDAIGRPVQPHDVAQMMVLLKVARSTSGTFHADDYEDACGYAALAGELAAGTGEGA